MRRDARPGLATRLALSVVIVLLVAAGLTAYYLFQGSGGQSTSVTLTLGIPPGPENAPQYYALQQGYYSSGGLNVTILPGTGGTAAIAAVSSGEVDFALTDASGLVYSLTKSNVTNVRIVAVLFPTSFFSVVYNEAAISSPDGIAGKPGAATNPSIGIATKLFLALADQNNLTVAPYLQFGSSQSVVWGDLGTGKVDYEVGGAHDIAFLQPSASLQGIQLGFFPFSDYGFTSYGEVLVTSSAMIADHGGVVKSFVSATLKGMVEAALNPAAAAAAEVRYQPQLNESQMLQGWNLDVACCMQGVTAATNPLAFGYPDPVRMQQTVNFVLLGEGVSTAVNATQFYSDAYTQQP